MSEETLRCGAEEDELELRDDACDGSEWLEEVCVELGGSIRFLLASAAKSPRVSAKSVSDSSRDLFE